MSGGLRLLPRSVEAVVFRDGEHQRTVATLLAAARQLAPRLEAYAQLLNLCADRGRFTVGLLAAILGGCTTLLPPNRQGGTLREFLERYPGSGVLYDGPAPELAASRLVEVRLEPQAALDADAGPVVEADRLCAVLFTSGSTGRPKANPKYWQTLTEGTRINGVELFAGFEAPPTVVATVPPTHMYGLETSILAPLLLEAAVVPGRPFYPADVAATLARQPRPRMLVTTPVHLRALLATVPELPPADRLLSATAPLAPELARTAEARFGCELREVYGCTETGCLAVRRPTQERAWRLMNGFRLEFDGQQASVCADHLPEPVALQDRIGSLGERHFELIGRSLDLVNIGGKRGSLGELTQRLLEVPGVEDGVIFLPEQAPGGPVERLAGLVVSARPVPEILARLRDTVDPAFLPRPLLRIERLPRGETGKLDRAALLASYTGLARERP